MIVRTHRFHGYNSLRFVYSRGQTVRGPLVSLRYCLNPRRTSYRAAVVVSRKVHKSAVVRNRIRRRLYEAIRMVSPGITQPHDLVFTVFSEQVAEMPADELLAGIADQLRRAGVIHGVPGLSPHAIVNTKER